MKHVMGAICLATAAAIWGASQVVSKFVMHETPPMTLTFVRFVLAALVLTIALGTKNKTHICFADFVFESRCSVFLVIPFPLAANCWAFVCLPPICAVLSMLFNKHINPALLESNDDRLIYDLTTNKGDLRTAR
jgi:drug/metabolite transporter (DMT)-like permease